MKTPRTFWLLMGALLLAPLLADAQNQTTTRLQAEAEVVKFSDQAGPKAAHSTGALSQEQSASILKLKDEYQAPKARVFQWTFAVRASQFQPKGSVRIPDVTTQDLSQSSGKVMPSFSLGSLYNFSGDRFGHWQFGLEAGFGVSTQNSSVKTAGPVAETRINSSFTEGHGLLRWSPSLSAGWHLAAGAGFGRLTMNQTSEESMVRWAKSADYRSSFLGADVNLGESWVLEARNRWQTAVGSANSEIGIPDSSLELGAKVIW